MSVIVKCASCDRRYQLDDKAVGKKVKCKGCGTVFVAQAASDAAPASRPPVAAPRNEPPPRQQPQEEDDPFAAMSALESATPPPMPAAGGSMYSGASARAIPAVTAAGPVAAYAFVAPPRPRVRSNKSLGLDPLTPILLLCLFLGLAATVYLGLDNIADEAKAENSHPLAVKAAKSMLWTMVVTFGVGHFAIIAPLVFLAVFVASKIMKFELPGASYLRAAGAAALPLVILVGIQVLAPSNIAVRLGLIVAILPLGFYAIMHMFELLLSETFVAYAFTCVFFVVGVFLSLMLSGVVAAAGLVQSQADIAKAIREDRDKQWEEQRASRNPGGRPPGFTPSYTPSSPNGGDQTPPTPLDPLETRAQSLQRRLEAFDARTLESFSRESAERDYAPIRTELASVPAAIKARPEWGTIDPLNKSIQQKIAALPTEQPDPAIFTPILSDPPFMPPANGVAALGEEVSFGRFNVRPPADARFDLRQSGPSGFHWRHNESAGEQCVITTQPRKNDKQQRPWIMTRSFQRPVAEKLGLMAIDVSGQSTVTYGSLAGLPAVRIDGETGASRRFIEYLVLDANNWISIRIQSSGGGEGMDLFEMAARTLRPRKAGEPTIDPFSPERVADRLGEDPDGVSAILRKNPVAAEPIVIRLLSSTDVRTRRAAADLLQFVVSDKTLSQLEPMVSHDDDHVAAAVRSILKKMKPQAFDEIAEILVDIKSDEVFKRRDAINKLTAMKPDEKRRNEVAAALEAIIMAERAFGFDVEAAAKALAVWPGDKTASRIAPLLNDPKLFSSRRDILLTAISGTRDKIAVNVVMKWMPQAPETVAPILIKMGPIAEDETIRVLNIYFANNTPDGPKVRAGCVSVLSEIGTAKSLEVLGRASRDKRDAVSQEAAKQAIETIKARTAKPVTKPA